MALDGLAAQMQTSTDADLSDPALNKIRDLIYRISGIFHAESKYYLLATRARRRMKTIGSETFSDYFDQLTTRAHRRRRF